MSDAGATPLFTDTSAFYARFVADAASHDRARAVFDAIQRGDLVYRPIYTATYVLDELVTLMASRHGHERAADTLDRIRRSEGVTLVHPTEDDFAAACEQFARYDDHALSLTDHMIGVLADDREIEHVFTFDPDDFRTLDFTAVPGDTGDASP